MATLSIINNFSLNSQGIIKEGKQGAIADGMSDALGITVTGTCHYMTGSIATATVNTIYDDDNDFPVDWDYLYFWADGIVYLQFIGSATNVILKIAATQPFVLPGYDSLLAAADTVIITGGSEPTLTDIDSVVLGNYSGTTVNYVFAVID